MAWLGTYSRALDTVPAAGEIASVPAPPPAVTPAVETSSAIPPAGSPAAPTLVPSGVPVAAKALAARAPSAKTFAPHPDRASVEIGTEDALQLFGEKRLFLDARRTSVYADGHIPGARSFPIWESDIADRVKAFYEEGLDQNAPIVIYCSGGDCEDSHMLAEKLYMVGFNNLLVYKDGFPGWQKRGLPAARGPKP
jgi:rhodanese-related sulfurtransferase